MVISSYGSSFQFGKSFKQEIECRPLGENSNQKQHKHFPVFSSVWVLYLLLHAIVLHTHIYVCVCKKKFFKQISEANELAPPWPSSYVNILVILWWDFLFSSIFLGKFWLFSGYLYKYIIWNFSYFIFIFSKQSIYIYICRKFCYDNSKNQYVFLLMCHHESSDNWLNIWWPNCMFGWSI